MIKAEIRLHEEPKKYQTSYQGINKALTWNSSKATRTENKAKPQESQYCRKMTQEEYEREVKYFLSKGFTVGQPLWEKYSTVSVPHEKVFVKILPPEFAFVRYFGGKEHYEIIETWQQNSDWFSTTCPHKLYKTSEEAQKGLSS